MKQFNKGLCILSGGQDSTTVLFHMTQVCNEVHAITFSYGQKHDRELEAARIVARKAGAVTHMVKMVPTLEGVSPLTNKAEKLETYNSYKEMVDDIGNRIELTFVPMRNLLFLTYAANRAVSICADVIAIGVSAEDTANYPDCRPGFINAAQQAINQALDGHLRVYAPLLDLTKSSSILWALGIPGCYEALAYTHTAYSNEFPPVTQDHATVLRAEGFRQAKIPDPLIARAVFLKEMECPGEDHYHPVRIIAAQEELPTLQSRLLRLAAAVGAI